MKTTYTLTKEQLEAALESNNNGDGFTTHRILSGLTELAAPSTSQDTGVCVQCGLYVPRDAESTDYIQTVPDKCDRIVWRNKYYHLENLKAAPSTSPAELRHDALVVNLMRRVDGIDKHKARECASVVFEMLKATPAAPSPSMPFVPWSKEAEMLESWAAPSTNSEKIGCVQHDCAECKARKAAPSTSQTKQVLEKFDELAAPSTSPTDDEMLAAFNSCEKVIDGLHAVFQLAAPSTSPAFLDQFKADPTDKWPGWMKELAVEKSASFPKLKQPVQPVNRLPVKQRVDIADACANLDWDDAYINCIGKVIDLVEAAHSIKEGGA